MKQLKLSLIAFTVLAFALAFAPANDARAQNGDLDILSRTVPPEVIIMLDSSGSMSNLILPPQYLTDRVAGGKVYPTSMNWYNKSNDVTNYPASFLATSATWYCGTGTATSAPCTTTWATKVYNGSAEDYRPTCQMFTSTSTSASATTGSNSQCMTTATPTNATCSVGGTTIANDDGDTSDPLGGAATMRCWNVPGGCTYVPAGLTCTTSTRARKKTSSTTVNQNYTIISFPNVSYTPNTTIPPNYIVVDDAADLQGEHARSSSTATSTATAPPSRRSPNW